jgi:hypothetical protein
VYNTIACSSIVIIALALDAFRVQFFGNAILKKNNNSINKKKTQIFFFLVLMQHAKLDGIEATNFDPCNFKINFH